MILWPDNLMPVGEHWHLIHTSVSGGVSLTGQEQIIASGFSRWRARLSFTVIKNERLMAFRAVIARLQGRTGRLVIGPSECNRINWGVNEYGQTLNPKFYRRSCLDDTPYADPNNLAQSLIDIRLASDMPERAVSLTINVIRGSTPKTGQYFSINNRLYLITDITDNNLSFLPNARETVKAGTRLEFIRPVARMRLNTDDAGALEMSLMRSGSAELDLIEVF